MHHCCTGKSPLSTLLCVLPSACWPACITTFALGLVAFSFSICSLLHAHCIQVLPFASCPLAITFCPWRCKHRCSCALNCGLYNPQLGCMPCVCQSINHCCAYMQRESEPQLFMVSSFNILSLSEEQVDNNKIEKRNSNNIFNCSCCSGGIAAENCCIHGTDSARHSCQIAQKQQDHQHHCICKANRKWSQCNLKH